MVKGTFAAAFMLAAVSGAACAGGFVERKVSVGGVERSYGIHVPSRLTKPAPLVFLFHGGGGRPEGIARRSGMDDLSDAKGFVAVYPRGIGRASGRRGTWNVGGAQGVSQASDVAFVKAIVDDVEKSVQVDRDRVYATGMSMGGVFSYRLACEMSDTFAAVAPVSATMVEERCSPSSPVAVFHVHGVVDDRIPLDGGRGDKTAPGRAWPAPRDGIATWRRLDGCGEEGDVTQEGDARCTTYARCRAPVKFCSVAAQGHTWPVGAASQAWEFFAAHPKVR